ncbi:MAG TPA: phasin family protein [Pseudolabrys sp.]
MNETRQIDATQKLKTATNEAMSSMEFPRFESSFFIMPSAFRTFADNEVTRRKETLETLSTATKEAYSTGVRGLNEYGQKIMEAGQRDADGLYDCYRDLMAAKSLPEVMDVWTTHAPRQLNAMSSRTGELWTLYWKVAADAAKPIAAGMSHTLANSK